MWVRTTLTIKRWTEEKPGCKTDIWEETKSTDTSRLPNWKRGHLASVESSSDVSSFSEGECKETDRCCWKHQQCAGHIIHPFSDCGHHNRHMHAVHCNCESRSKSYRPVSVAVFHHPIHHVCRTGVLNEEDEGETPSSIPTKCPNAVATDPDIRPGPGAPDSAAPITIWRSESPTDKSQEGKVIKKIKKKKEKEKDKEDEIVDEKAKLKKKVKKGKLTKKKSPVKSESSPPDMSRSLSPRELVRTSESSPESREELESEDSYDRGKEGPSSEDIVDSSSPRKREKSTPQAKKNGTKTLQTRKMSKRKSPPVSNPNLS
ncbi:Proca1 [Phodopus roborovskii]|uniref:Proca1 protein n=1 Tax=Phodopus roborovskii TaxID=109678 RepID=A0AAU9Z0X4_PHORO|nr:Proca1 [Phodopus roborovskii]